MTGKEAENLSVGTQEARAFVLAAVALATGIFGIAFWFGIFQTVFFEHLFYIWVASTVAFATSLFVPPIDALPALMSWRGRVVLLLPTVWLLLEANSGITAATSSIDERLLWALSIGVVALTLPYLLYVLVFITVPDVDRLKSPKLRRALCGIVIVIAMAGFAIGQNHRLFLTCQDFKVSGDDVPLDCRKALSQSSSTHEIPVPFIDNESR